MIDERIEAFVYSAAEAFGLHGPVYCFGLPLGPDSAARALSARFGDVVCCDIRAAQPAKIGRLPFSDGVAPIVLYAGAAECVGRPHPPPEELRRILAPGGVLLVCLAVEPARSPSVRWQLTPCSVQRFFGSMQSTLVAWQGVETCPHTVYGIGFEPPAGVAKLAAGERFAALLETRLGRLSARTGPWQRLKELLADCTQGRWQRRRRRDREKLHFTLHTSVDRSLKPGLLQDCLPDLTTGTRLDLMD